MSTFSEILPTPFFNGKLVVYQPAKGYRFGIEAILLGSFLKIKSGEKAVELGAGSGIISFMAAKRFPTAKIWMIELGSLFIECLKRTIRENKLEGSVFCVKGDFLRIPLKLGIWDVVFSNPPYFKTGCGRESPDHLKNIAKRGSREFLESFVKIVSQLLKNGGRFYVIFTALRAAELMFLLKKHRLEPKTLRFVHSYPGDEARFVMMETIKGAKEEIRVKSPLFIYQHPRGPYTQEVLDMLTLL